MILDYYYNGERIREYLKIHILTGDKTAKDKKLLAEKIRSQRELELSNENLGYVAPHKRNTDFFFFFEEFIKKTTRKDPRLFEACLSHLKKYCGRSHLPCSSLNREFSQNFRNYLGRHLNGETPFNYYGVYRRVVSEAMKEKILAFNPCYGVQNKKPSGKILGKDVLSDSELRLLFNTACNSDNLKRAFLFCCFTGLRAVDVRELRWKNIDVKNKSFKFSQSKTGVRMLPPLSETAIDLLGEEGKPNDLVFDLPTHEAMNKTLKAWVVRAKIKKHITFHCARHTFATSLLVHGADLKTTSELLGHTTTRETEKYTHISEQMKRKAVDALPPLV